MYYKKFDINKYENTQEKLKNYEDKIRVLEDLKSDIELLIRHTQDKCNHDLILCYGYDYCNNTIKKAKCLVCDDYFELDDNIEIFTEREIDQNKIIDVTDKVSEYSQNKTKSGESVLVLRAKEKLAEMIEFAKRNNREYGLDLLKNVLSNTMIAYDEDLKRERKRLVKNNNKK